MTPKSAALLALLAAAVLLVAGCGDEQSGAPLPEPPAADTGGAVADPPAPPVPEPSAPPEPKGPPRGGVYRVGVENDFNFSGGFDPVGEYLTWAWSMYSVLLRNLVTYKHVAGPEGGELVPDLATDLGQVSDDGLTYTFTLKDGIKFGPPLSREITSRDIEYAFERIGTESLVAQYGFYYDGVIEGLSEFTAGEADSISGIETPDDKTIVFTLTQPTGDFLFRLAMPAAAAVPEEVAGCFSEAGEYGRYLVASGPYMIESSDALDATSCDTLEPISGYDPNASLSLVRNPDYEPATDDPEVREANPDGFLFTINTNADDIFNKVAAGELEGEQASDPGKVIKEYSETPELQDRMKVNPDDSVWFLFLNLTQPPFDDVHVRRAVNFVMDKAGLQRAWGGPLQGEVATHIYPSTVLAGQLADYDPYPSEGFAGDVEAAKAEMAQSKYDSDGDGVCDAPECEGVLHVSRTSKTWVNMEPVIEQSLARIGIELKTRAFEDAIPVIQTTAKNVPIGSVAGWGKDYPDASTYAVLFDSRVIIPTGNINFSLVGLAPEQAPELGVEGTVEDIPSVDADIDACNAAFDLAERATCWAGLDRRLMEEVVPWIPYLWGNKVDILGPAVVQYAFDQFSGETAYAHVAVDPAKQ